jgi:hypothetical protein
MIFDIAFRNEGLYKSPSATQTLMNLSRILCIAAFCGLIPGYNEAIASLMKYTTTEVGSGTFGGVAFNNAVITLTLFGDTDNVTTSSVTYPGVGTETDAYLFTSSATVSVAGIGKGTFLQPLLLQRQTYSWVPLDISGAILISHAPGAEIFWSVKDNPLIATYSFGPAQFSGLTPPYASDINEPTTFGEFVCPWPGPITSGAGTFEAVVVPEPSCPLLLCSCVMLAALFRHRRLLVS